MKNSEFFEIVKICLFTLMVMLYFVVRWAGAWILAAALFSFFFDALIPVYAKLPVPYACTLFLLLLSAFVAGCVLHWIFAKVFDRAEEFMETKMVNRQQCLTTEYSE